MGQVFEISKHGFGDWMKEQAQNPFTLVLPEVVRVYFNCRAKRDVEGKSISYAGYVDLDRKDLTKVVDVSKNPVLLPGGTGAFDEFGVMEGSVIPVREKQFLYYCGWSRMQSVPYNWAIGLAISCDNAKTFTKYGKGPILGATYNEPFLQAGCSSVKLVDGLFHMWYTSGIKWIKTSEKPESVYQIMHCTSQDGIHWKRNGIPIIKPVFENEAQASPSVIKIGNKWHMFFSYRHSVNFRNKDRGYRIGYAWSDDLKIWHRDDEEAGLQVSETGWDSEMVCYPHVNEIDGNIFMFYCGNDFGKEGFGYAKLIDIG